VYKRVRMAVRMTMASQSSFSRGTLLLNLDPTRPFEKHYKKETKVGEGGFGTVYLCRHLATDECRAVKIIAKTQVKEDMEQVVTEMEALFRLDHPNVVKLHEFFEQKNNVLVVVEFCSEGDFAKLHKERVPMENVRPFFRDVALGLAYCHDLQIVHRDLKFENCLLTQGQTRKIAKIIDFGLSAIKRHEDLGAESPASPSVKKSDECWLSEALGTRWFAAPEVIDRSIKYGVKCDMWSFGVMIYIMFTNEHPFAKDAAKQSHMDLFAKVLTGRYREEPLRRMGVPLDAQVLLRNLLMKDPSRRIDATQALKFDWLRPVAFTEMSVTSVLSQEQSKSMASRLDHWSEISHFDKVVLMLVAHQAKQTQIETMRAAFLALDKDGNGTLSKQELKAGLKSMGQTMSEAHFEEMYHWLDSNENSTLDYSEWLCATMEPSIIAAESSIRELFDYFDSDADGELSREELCRVTGAEEAKGILEQHDTSKDGFIDFHEFKTMVEHIAQVRSRAG